MPDRLPASRVLTLVLRELLRAALAALWTEGNAGAGQLSQQVLLPALVRSAACLGPTQLDAVLAVLWSQCLCACPACCHPQQTVSATLCHFGCMLAKRLTWTLP